MTAKEAALFQLDELLNEYKALLGRARHDDLSDLPEGDCVRFITRARAAVIRIAGVPSAYLDQFEQINKGNGYPGSLAVQLVGIVDSLRADVSADFLASQRELIHGELFADFLEMSQHLLDEGYKDAAAVIVGSSLEAHLRQLCVKAGIDATVHTPTGVVAKKAERLNAELTAARVYTVLDQKNVTAWLDLRNKAAHGHYEGYQSGQVTLFISSIRDFISRHPA